MFLEKKEDIKQIEYIRASESMNLPGQNQINKIQGDMKVSNLSIINVDVGRSTYLHNVSVCL